jgi:hypothetical protein
MQLENWEKEVKVISEAVKLAKEVGATERDLAPVKNALIYGPLSKLGRYQDLKIINEAEMLSLPPPRKPDDPSS